MIELRTLLEPWLGLLTVAGTAFFLLGLGLAAALALRRHLEERRASTTLGPEQVRRRLLALASRPDLPPVGPWPPPDELLDLVEETASMVKGELRAQLAVRAREIGVLDRLLERARSRRASLRERAARALELFLPVDPPAVRAPLLRLSEDVHGAVRIAAAESLLADGDGTVRRIAARARSDPAFATAAALRFFERLADRLPAEAAALLADPADPRARLVAEAAARTRAHALTPALLAALSGARGALRVALVRALVALDHPAGFAALERLAADVDPQLRLAALAVVRADAGARLLPLLRRRLADPDPRVALRAAELAADLGAPWIAPAVGAAA